MSRLFFAESGFGLLAKRTNFGRSVADMFITANTANPNRTADSFRLFNFILDGNFFNVGQFHNFLRGEIFIAKRRVRRKINRFILLNKGANSIERVAGGV